ncbi:MAG: ATP-binding cassette domain-containing protein [Spirochaetales bacterium]|nr:ATP-binding cassette domain-containing protein [Spirochaetales bacterium]
MTVESVTVLGGQNKSGQPEKVGQLDILKGQVYSVVGFTGSGKSQLISDIEQMACRDSVSGRQILINGQIPLPSLRYNPETKLVAQLSQNMNFVLEMTVMEFLDLHAGCRGFNKDSLKDVLEAANTLAGEKIRADDILTRLSGGQSRALMIADVAYISNSPIILIDEVENAGIDRTRALNLLSGKGKIVLIVTHDPHLALSGEKRIVMKNGGIHSVLSRTEEEVIMEQLLGSYQDVMTHSREILRSGGTLDPRELMQEVK